MDWKTRFKNKAFLVSLMSGILIVAQLVLQPFGITFDNNYIMTTFNAVLAVLVVLGIVVDPTTPGVTDRLKRANMPARQYKLKKDAQDIRDLKFEHYVLAAPAVDLRPNMPPIDDQGDLGSCSANALIGIMGYLRLKAKVPFVKLSRLYAYYKERALDGNINEDCGSTVRNECKVASKGVCEEKIWPYVISKFDVTPSPQADANAIYKINTYKSVSGLDGIKKALTLGSPVAIGIEIYESFESAIVAKTGKIPLPRKSEKLLGGHAVVVCGYDDKKKVLICRNSWGEGWGDKGYFYLPYSYMKYVFDCWVMQ